MDHRCILEEEILTTIYRDFFRNADNTKHQEIFQNITEEIACFIKYVPKLKLNKELDRRFKKAIKVAAIYHKKDDIETLWVKEKYKKGFNEYVQILSGLEDENNKLGKNASIVEIETFLKRLLEQQFENVLLEKAFFLWHQKDCETMYKKLKFSFKAALALTYMDLVDTDEMMSEMKEMRAKLVIYSAMVSTIHKYRWKISGYVNYITDRLPTIKLGLEPEEFDSISIMYLNKFWCEFDELQDDLDIKYKIRQRIQKCLKKHLPRQNISNKCMDGRRRGGNDAYTVYCHFYGLDETLTPFQMNQENGSSSNRIGAYHNDAKNLYILENVLTEGYAVNVKGVLTRNGQPVPHDEFLDFLKKWTLDRIKTLRSVKNTEKQKRDVGEGEVIDRLTLAFRSVFGRYCFEMSKGNDKDKEDARITWQNHIDVISAFSVLVAVFDELFHLHHGEGVCGINTIIKTAICQQQREVPTNRECLLQFVYQCVGIYFAIALSQNQ